MTAEKGNALAKGGKAMVMELSSKVPETATDMERRIENLDQSGNQTAADLSTQARDTASGVSKATAENARKLPEKGTNAINKAPDIVKSVLNDAE
ncbi:hypothetical protein FSOLCH5_013493 [Fusarium solani]